MIGVQNIVVECKAGVNLHKVSVSEETVVIVDMPENTTGSLCLEIVGSGQLDLMIHARNNSDFKYLWINHSDESLNVNETIEVYSGANLTASYGEMSAGNHRKNTCIHFTGEKSKVELRGAIVTFNNLKWEITALHQARRTAAFVNCNAIVLENAKLHLEIAGKIDKGYSGSETHQMSRIMNLGSNSKGVVYPKLLIDENDVAASHAASVGQPNEEHIYYLQSRGLTRIESLKLITMGYLMPIVDGIDSIEIKEALEQEIKEKVNQQWL